MVNVVVIDVLLLLLKLQLLPLLFLLLDGGFWVKELHTCRQLVHQLVPQQGNFVLEQVGEFAVQGGVLEFNLVLHGSFLLLLSCHDDDCCW